MKCDRCVKEKESKGEKLPRGWKRFQGRNWCDSCWQASFVLRAITIPVAGPVNAEWPELREALNQCWANSTALANWAVTELAKADMPRTPEMERMPKAPSPYLYPGARRCVPSMDPQSVTALLRSVEAKYRASRKDVIWLRSASHSNYRYAVPYPIHNQAWNAKIGADGEALVSARFGGQRWTLRLRGGQEFARQLRAHKQLASGEAMLGELAIYGKPSQESSHRNGVQGRRAGGGRNVTERVMVKMVGWFPRKSRETQRDGSVLYVRTDPESLWVYHVGEDGEPKRLNADHVRRWVAGHRRRLHRMSDDLKHEKRWPKKTRKNMVESQEPRIRKMHNRLESFCHESTAMLAKFAERHRVATVRYDDTDQSFVDKFPWHMLRTMLGYKLDERGIQLELTGRDA